MTSPADAFALQVGSAAPDFELSNQHGEPVRLSSLRGQNVVVVFYPFAFSGICTGELCEIRDNLGDFTTANATVLAVSVDSKFTLRAYADKEGYDFDLLADFWPHGGVASLYGVFDPDSGMARRGTFIIDAQGIIRYVVVNPRGRARDLQEYRQALSELSTAASEESAAVAVGPAQG
ncbi:peroxiredoxin [Pseudarthrobacter sp. J75]|uniref:peroxiredoxin n=1 Tax=unclassified Pseudarthrobacter TaxID=2647000 RepID=UPI002E81F3E0|nr:MULTISPECIES: peroxiredoxin [unclassified Pseudarthrobacter]MEE2522914.1 peroxiredoxin [Pseudarthrobacter sp. J47]MEE2530633.1 peroxiredoxin [Pseudarthrobacter sp. J75]